MPQVPGKVVAEFLRATVDVPAPKWFKSVVIASKNSTRTITIGCAQRADVDSIRPVCNRL